MQRLLPGFSVETIGSRFGYILPDGTAGVGIPPVLPTPAWPWEAPGPDGKPLGISYSLVRQLLEPAMAIALLGAIESLLCAVVADGMTGKKHDPDGELIGQGIANIVAPFFGGFAATGAIARTATSIRAGARSPLAAVFHAVFILGALVALAPLLSYLPIASLAGLLLMVAWNMSDVRHFGHVVRVAPKSDVLVLLACFGLTVIFDMVVSVGVGVVLAAFLFMRRMAEVTSARVIENGDADTEPFPEGVLSYEIRGPLFFGAAEKAFNALERVAPDLRAVVIHIHHVPVMDVTGLVALESVVGKLLSRGVEVCLVGVEGQPLELLRKSKLLRAENLHLVSSPEEARRRLGVSGCEGDTRRTGPISSSPPALPRE
jgi:SulP family sulfate permease